MKKGPEKSVDTGRQAIVSEAKAVNSRMLAFKLHQGPQEVQPLGPPIPVGMEAPVFGWLEANATSITKEKEHKIHDKTNTDGQKPKSEVKESVGTTKAVEEIRVHTNTYLMGPIRIFQASAETSLRGFKSGTIEANKFH